MILARYSGGVNSDPANTERSQSLGLVPSYAGSDKSYDPDAYDEFNRYLSTRDDGYEPRPPPESWQVSAAGEYRIKQIECELNRLRRLFKCATSDGRRDEILCDAMDFENEIECIRDV